MYAAQASKVRGSASLRCRSEMKSMACQCCGATHSVAGGSTVGTADIAGERLSADLDGAHDRHRFQRHVGMAALVAGAHLLDRVHHLGALDHAAEDRIAPALRRFGA